MDDTVDGWREEAIRQLEQEERQLDAQALQIDLRKAQIQTQKLRIQQPLPEPDICPECWLAHGIPSPLKPSSSGALRGKDRWECSRCPHSETRKA